MPEERVHKIVVPTVARVWCGAKSVEVNAFRLGRWECCDRALEHLLLLSPDYVTIDLASRFNGFDRTPVFYCPWCGVKFELIKGEEKFMKYVRRPGDVGDWVDCDESEFERLLKGES